MPRYQDRDRANLGEQADMSRTDIERQDRSMDADSRGDAMAGAEGIEDPAMERSSRDSMDSSSSGNGRASSGEVARASKRARYRSRRHKRETTSFSGQGGQKEGSMNEEGTGYTERSKTEDSESEDR